MCHYHNSNILGSSPSGWFPKCRPIDTFIIFWNRLQTRKGVASNPSRPFANTHARWGGGNYRNKGKMDVFVITIFWTNWSINRKRTKCYSNKYILSIHSLSMQSQKELEEGGEEGKRFPRWANMNTYRDYTRYQRIGCANLDIHA